MSFDRENILKYAKNKVENFNKGKNFTVIELFDGMEEYLKLSKIDKQNIGRLIKNEVECGNINGVLLTGQRSKNRLEYKKIS